MSDNPFAAPSAIHDPRAAHHVGKDSAPDELAGRFTRFAAVMVDGIVLMVILVPVQFVTGYFKRAMAQEIGIGEQIGMSLVGMAVMLLLNGYLLFTRGQTIGKMLTGIQIVDVDSGKILPFMRVYVYRYLWTLPLVVIITLIPGVFDDLLLNVVMLIDVLLIFGAARRCLHDYIAGSKVVLYRENRTKLS